MFATVAVGPGHIKSGTLTTTNIGCSPSYTDRFVLAEGDIASGCPLLAVNGCYHCHRGFGGSGGVGGGN